MTDDIHKTAPIDVSFLHEGAAKVDEAQVGGLMARVSELWARLEASPALQTHLDEVQTLVELVGDWRSGAYRQVPFTAIALITFALLYVLNPVDLIPDALPLVGHLDDSAVLALCLRLVRPELEAWRAWKASGAKATGDATEPTPAEPIAEG